MSAFARFLAVIFTLARVGVGLLIVSAGLELARGNSLFSNSPYDSFFTGAFVMLIGAACILAAIFPRLFGDRR